MEKGAAWQCKCGHIEYTKDLPEDCPKCFRVGKFDPVPEDVLEEKEAEEILSMSGDGDNDDDDWEEE